MLMGYIQQLGHENIGIHDLQFHEAPVAVKLHSIAICILQDRRIANVVLLFKNGKLDTKLEWWLKAESKWPFFWLKICNKQYTAEISAGTIAVYIMYN